MSMNNQNSSGSNNHTDPEVEHSSVKTQMNVEFVEQQPQVADDARLGYSIPTLPATLEAQMPDENWMAAKQLSKPIVIDHVSWSVDSAAGTLLISYNFPQIIGAQDSIHQETLRMYSFYKFNWVLRFQINGTKFHSGQVIASWDPFGSAQAVTSYYRPFNVVYATGLPNVMLNASSNEPMELTIPFVHPRNFLTTNSGDGTDFLGTVRLNVLNPLRAADGSSQALSITTWLYADSPSVHVPIHRHDIVLPAAEIAERSMDLIKSLVGEDVTNLVGDVGSTFGNLVTGNFGGAIKSGGSSLTGLAKVLGLDYPSRIVIPQSHINSLGPMSPGKGVDGSYRFALDPRSGQVITPDRTGSTIDECDLTFILKTPMLFRQVSWTDTSTIGTELTVIPVSPQLSARGAVGTKGFVSPTYLSWFSQAFAFWRGGIIFKFEFVSTQFHTGRLLMAFVPNEYTQAATLSLEQAYSCPNVIIDLQQNSTVTLTVPFVSSTLWKTTNLIGDVVIPDESVIGTVHVFVLNPLVRPSNVSDTIEFNIYVYAADDFCFAVPKSNRASIRSTAPAELAERSIGSARIVTRTGGQDDNSSVSLSFGDPLVPPMDTFGEQFSLVDYIKRYGGNSSVTTTANKFLTIPNRPLAYFNADAATELPIDVGVSTQMTPLATVLSVFACWFGSLRYKIVTNATRTDTGFMVVTHAPLNETANTGDSTGGGKAIQRTNLAQNNSLDVELPCYTPYNLLIAHPVGNNVRSVYSDAGALHVRIDGRPTNSPSLQLDLYQAAGDDFRPFYLISPPADFSTGGYVAAALRV